MSYANAVKVAGIVRDAGSRIVGRTRLQKVAYLLSVTGLEDGLPFVYKHYGPYSEDLATAARDATCHVVNPIETWDRLGFGELVHHTLHRVAHPQHLAAILERRAH